LYNSGCFRSCFTTALMAASLNASYSRVPSWIALAISESPVCPSSLPSGEYPKGVSPASKIFSTLRWIRWYLRSYLPIICVHVPSFSGTVNFDKLDFLAEFGFTCPLICLPSFRNVFCDVRLFSLDFSSCCILSSLSMAHDSSSSVRCGNSSSRAQSLLPAHKMTRLSLLRLTRL
jgi:hypothetical protein